MPKAENPTEKSPSGLSQIKTCRFCGCFRFATFYAIPGYIYKWKWNVRIVSATEGWHEIDLNWNEAKPIPKARRIKDGLLAGGVLL
jgi:hypothetical protein